MSAWTNYWLAVAEQSEKISQLLVAADEALLVSVVEMGFHPQRIEWELAKRVLVLDRGVRWPMPEIKVEAGRLVITTHVMDETVKANVEQWIACYDRRDTLTMDITEESL